MWAWLKDNKQVIAWGVAALTRGLAWVFAAKLGLDAAEAQSSAGTIANALGAIVLVVASMATSIKGRKTLRDTQPPK